MILITDDDSAIRSSELYCCEAKYDVQAVPGPKEAIEIVPFGLHPVNLDGYELHPCLFVGEEGLTLLKQVKVFRPMFWLY